MKLNFIGATHGVTGSLTLLTTETGLFLIDSGLHQGTLDIAKRNLLELPFNPKDISAIFLTHAHLDHSGLIPRLVKLGFRGNIYCTRPTMKLANVIMLDSAHIIEETKNHPLKDFYSVKNAVMTTSFFKVVEFNKPFIFKDLELTYLNAGHILGAASIEITHKGKSVVFSGDLGRSDDPLLPAPTACPSVDLVVMESTYGGRTRESEPLVELEKFIKKIKEQSSVGIIASFSVSRAQNLIYLITQYFNQNPEDAIRLVIDGPMMVAANNIYKEFSAETKVTEEFLDALKNVEVIEHTREWESLKKKTGPLLIITSSGMITGGRIWRYLENWQYDPNAVLFLPGYQAEGTPGRALSEGIKQVQSEEGQVINWSGEVISSSAFSSHADQNELIHWLKDISKESLIYLNHGEQEAKIQLQEKLIELGYQCFIAGNNIVKI